MILISLFGRMAEGGGRGRKQEFKSKKFHAVFFTLNFMPMKFSYNDEFPEHHS
jgi:hypothetical protein